MSLKNLTKSAAEQCLSLRNLTTNQLNLNTRREHFVNSAPVQAVAGKFFLQPKILLHELARFLTAYIAPR